MDEKERLIYVANSDKYKYAAEEHRRQDNQSKRMVSVHGSDVPINVKVSELCFMLVYNIIRNQVKLMSKNQTTQPGFY